MTTSTAGIGDYGRLTWAGSTDDPNYMTAPDPFRGYILHRRCNYEADTLDIWVTEQGSDLKSEVVNFTLSDMQNLVNREVMLRAQFLRLSKEVETYRLVLRGMKVK